MKSFKGLGVVTLSMSIGLLALPSLEVSRCESAIAAVPGAEANVFQSRQQRAFFPEREWIGPHEGKPMLSRSTLRTLMTQSMGRTCVISNGSKCEKEDSAPIGSACICDTERGRVVKGDGKTHVVEKGGKAIETKKKSTPGKDNDKDTEKDKAKK